jgi:IS605 OrfB family transposase
MNLILTRLKIYYNIYSNSKQLIDTNNNIIYGHIKNKLNNIILNSSNIKLYYNKITDELKNICHYDSANKEFVFTNIIDRIIKSFYDKKYFYTRYQMLNHINLTYNDSQLINDIKNNNYYYETINDINYKIKIETDFSNIMPKDKTLFKSDQYIFKLFVYENCLGNNKNKLPADIILNLINKYHEMITSYYGKIKKKLKANKPKYLDKNDRFNLYYFTSSFKIVNNTARLTVGKYISDNFNNFNKNELYKINQRKYCHKNNIIQNIKNKNKKDYIKLNSGYVNKNKIIDANYLNLKLPKILKDKKIKLIQIKAYGNNFIAYISYEELINIQKTDINISINNSISIDTGIKNLLTIYNPTGDQHIIKGNKIKSINEFYNKKISELQIINKKELNINQFNRLYSLLTERKNKINGEINKIVNKLIETYNDKKYFIVGYNDNWKTGIHLGRNINRIFYGIPYTRILDKLKEKLTSIGKELIKNEESYTSKCDGLSLEIIGRKTEYSGNRIHRGLFISSTGKAINADLNGAINIMRKVIDITKVVGNKLFNPTILVT